ncbi:hypothetical protein SAMN05444920_104514 [Nonomuraea solani]|uniref:Uncharacterized protein n=1 Tax=Nonomuraea solani TaxID=1144553 RepID=A0A1H6CYL2_9ACTN|nr:DUF6653 family protein [Nonomuraea solani]SEG77655.1 hypothetical protein SAMN05444920_104514 [Nonomuraea solani]
MNVPKRYARAVGMTDEAWKRHANPWSVWTRFAAIPLMIGAIWSREWLGWWALVPVALVVVWLALNPHVFPPIERPESWTARGIYGEKMWLRDRSLISDDHRNVQRLLIGVGSAGFALLGWGLVALEPWPTVFGATLITLGQLWRIDRLGLLYLESTGHTTTS